MGRHARDDDARSAGLDDLAEFVPGSMRHEQVDSQDGFQPSLAVARVRRVDDVGEPAARAREIRQLGNGTLRRDVDPPGSDVVTSITNCSAALAN